MADLRVDATEADDMAVHASIRFRRMVESVGVKRFASDMDLSTRQINRMISGAQANPIERILLSLQCSQADIGDETLSFICQEAGGYFVKEVGPLDTASVNAVKECAEAIAAISDGEITELDQNEVREAISALIGLLRTVGEERGATVARPVIHTRSVPSRL
jgi:hypothetical protein